jgi:hypothetical protein
MLSALAVNRVLLLRTIVAGLVGVAVPLWPAPPAHGLVVPFAACAAVGGVLALILLVPPSIERRRRNPSA